MQINQQPTTGLDASALEQAKQLTADYFEAMRQLAASIQDKTRGKGLILKTYFRAKSLAQLHRLPTPPLRDKPETVVLFNAGKNNLPEKVAPSNSAALSPVMAPEVVYDADPDTQDRKEIDDYRAAKRRGRPSAK